MLLGWVWSDTFFSETISLSGNNWYQMLCKLPMCVEVYTMKTYGEAMNYLSDFTNDWMIANFSVLNKKNKSGMAYGGEWERIYEWTKIIQSPTHLGKMHASFQLGITRSDHAIWSKYSKSQMYWGVTQAPTQMDIRA